MNMLDDNCPIPTAEEQLRATGKRSLVGIIASTAIVIAILCVLAGNAHAAVTGEWRVNLIKGSSTVSPASVGATQEAAWAACQARIPLTATTKATWKCQTPVYIAVVSPDPPPTCPPAPASTTRSQDCPTGTTGTWTQTSAHTVGAPPACTVSTTWTPSSPPDGACTAIPPPLTAPTLAVPTMTANAANPSSSDVTLTWTAVPGATSYEVERCPMAGVACPTFSPLATVTALTYTNSNLPPGTELRYRNRGIDATRKGPYSITHTITTPTAPPTGANTVKVNAGGSALDGYAADQYFVGGSVSSSCNRPATGIYATRRYSSSNLEYRIPLPNARYLVRLLWNECWHTGPGQRVFTASVEGLALATVDPWRADGAPTTHDRIIDLTDGVVNIALSPITGDAMINAIEISPTTDQPTPQPTFSATLNWTPSTANTNGTPLTDLAGFRIVYGSAPGALTRTITIPNPATNRFAVDQLTAGSWYFAITEYSSAGFESAPSNHVTRVLP